MQSGSYRWDIVKLFSDGGVRDVSIDDLTHFDAQDSPDPHVESSPVLSNYGSTSWMFLTMLCLLVRRGRPTL